MLSIRHLGFRYSGAPAGAPAALDDVSLQAPRGSVLGLLGPNGAGKTTLISHLAGLLPLQRGEILIDDEPLAAVRARMPTRISVAPQEFAFYPMLTVAQNLECFAAAARIGRQQRRQRIDACLATAQLDHVTASRADQLSGGLKRRLNLAIALLAEPELILFDEPTVGVDPQTRAFVLRAIKALATNGAAVIYTSHYMEEIEAIADRVVILDHGRVLRDGALNELLAEGAMTLTVSADGIAPAALAALLGRFGTLEPGDAKDKNDADDAKATTQRLRLAPGQAPAAVFATLDAAGAQLRHAELGRWNLERLFMALTQRSLRD
jgi:ABC-2 type transport system ATP-binding protein